jgi:molybdate-binding protein
MVVPKSSIRWVHHHAIYLGVQDGDNWFIENQAGVGVRPITAKQFFSGALEVTRVERFKPRWNYTRDDLVQFALNKRGKKYALLGYNFESFANQVQHGRVKSKQAETGLALGAVAALVLLIFLPLGRR